MPAPTRTTSRPGTRGEPEKTRAAILKASLHEFAAEGVAGARIDEIARTAGVNKALLYYYFHDKESLYGAVIDDIFQQMRERLLVVLNSDVPPPEKIIAYIGTHFDYIASDPEYPRLVQQEMMRSGRQKSPHLKRIAQMYFQPVYSRILEVIEEGMNAGYFRTVDPRRFAMTMAAVVVHYFNALPLAQLMGNKDPLSPESVAAQRAAVLDFITHALFIAETGRPHQAASTEL
ncbi:MAG TPA: TetR/AcrR family transcriptional regulator [Terriglobales bacterium]|nr:TetR/AcrR family transcriptional regulator [Terriglobales bacterium]